jgi:hypothetical protein
LRVRIPVIRRQSVQRLSDYVLQERRRLFE